MKKCVMMAVAVCLVMTACEKAIEVPDGEASGVVEEPVKTKKFTFTMKGDFSGEWKKNGNGIAEQKTKQAARRTAGYLAADGRDMADVWVLDYMNGQLVQQLHQGDNTAEDFGKPVMSLAYGSHHVYFVASRGTTPTLNAGTHSIVWERPSDTFYKDYEVNVVSTSNGNRAVTLDRVATKLKLTVTDEVKAECAEVAVEPVAWYYGWDYVNGAPVAQQQTERVVAVPANLVGTSGQLAVAIFGLSGSTEWTTDVTVSARTAEHAVIGTATMTDVPFKANRATEYSGPLFGSGGSLTLSLNTDWLDAETDTW
jgi:hypothetical protein